MVDFPSLTELLIPNFNEYTLLGSLILVLVGLGFTTLPRKISFGAIIVGISLIWGVSFIEDFLATSGGTVIFWGTLILLGIALVRFGLPKK